MNIIECPVPVQELLEVHIEHTSVALVDDTAVGCELTIVHIQDSRTSCLIHTNTGIEGKCEVLEELGLYVRRTIDCITLAVSDIEPKLLKRI